MVEDQTDCEVYQDFVNKTTDAHCVEDIEWAVLGLAGEVGEVASLVVKAKRKKKEINEQDLLDECGDCLWYLVAVLNSCGLDLDDCIEHNIDKLVRRGNVVQA